MRQLIRTYEITGQHEITISDYSFTKEDVRLIINESLASTNKLASVLVSSTAKDNIVSVEEGIITLADTTAELNTDDVLTIEIDIDNVAKEENATANKNELSRQIDYYGDQIERVTEDTVKAAKKDIKGADSTKIFDCVTSIPALEWQDYSQLVLNDGEYAIGNWVADMESPDEIKVGTVLRASNPDVTMPIILIKSTTTQSQISVSGDAEDGWILPDDAIDEVIHIEAGKNYVCTGTKLLRKIRLGQPALRGTLYLWEEYDGCSIHDAKEEIITAIDNIDVDTSDLAKQGDNPDVSLTSVDEKIDDFYDTFDADIALQLQGIIGDTEESESDSESESIEGTSQTQQQISELRTLRESINSLANDVNALKDAHVIKNVNYDGIVFQEGFIPSSALEVLAHEEKIEEINDDEILAIGPFAGYFPLCEKIRFENVVLMDGLGRLVFDRDSFPALVEADFPNLTAVQNVQNYYLPFSRIQTLRTLKVPKMTSFPFLRENGAYVMDVWTGAYFNSNVNMSSWGTATTSGKNLSTTSVNLLTEEDIAAGFTSNAEKLLWNVRNHIAAFLPDRTGETAYTITFDSVLKAAILADTDTANAFADKNWTVA